MSEPRIRTCSSQMTAAMRWYLVLIAGSTLLRATLHCIALGAPSLSTFRNSPRAATVWSGFFTNMSPMKLEGRSLTPNTFKRCLARRWCELSRSGRKRSISTFRECSYASQRRTRSRAYFREFKSPSRDSARLITRRKYCFSKSMGSKAAAAFALGGGSGRALVMVLTACSAATLSRSTANSPYLVHTTRP